MSEHRASKDRLQELAVKCMPHAMTAAMVQSSHGIGLARLDIRVASDIAVEMARCIRARIEALPDANTEAERDVVIGEAILKASVIADKRTMAGRPGKGGGAA